MSTRCFSIPYHDKLIEACVNESPDEFNGGYGLVLTHGAGGDMYMPQLTLLAEILANKGITVIRFTCKGLNLSYRIKVYTAVLEYVSLNFSHLEKVFVSGRSMGARAAVGVANGISESKLNNFITGVISLSYPLHLKDKKSELRDSALYEVKKPILFISGTNDEMCDALIFEKVLENVTNDEIYWISNADHSLKVKGSSENEVIEKICEYIISWCGKHCKSQTETNTVQRTESFKVCTKRKNKGLL